MYKTTLVLAACFAVPALSAPIYVVAPNFNAGVVGNSPDNITGDSGNNRFQEDIGRGQFTAFNGPVWITEVAFRAVPGTGTVNFPISNVDLYLSTSPLFPNTNGGQNLISSTFADNVGTDNMLVFSGPFTLSSPGCAAGATPCPFDMVLTFSSPFLYNRANGTLLFDFRFTGMNGVSGTLDSVAFNPPGGPVAQVSGPLDATVGGMGLHGEVVQLTVEATPEPASWALILSGLAAIPAFARRRKS